MDLGIRFHMLTTLDELVPRCEKILRGEYLKVKPFVELLPNSYPIAVRWLSCIPGISVEKSLVIVDKIMSVEPKCGLEELSNYLLEEDLQNVLDDVFGLKKDGSRKENVKKIMEVVRTGGI